MVLESRQGALLGARIASDGQWRFPEIDSIPHKFETALVEFEDRRFYYHPGIDPIGLGRALLQNARHGSIVSGGSTITMQVIRMARDNPPRTLWQKGIEAILATRLELGYSKQEILALYASHAPFGGNVVGIEAASWRYFGKNPQLLSWAEAAMLAVLPNSPALIHPGRNRQALLAKRNRLLKRLQEAGHIDGFTCELAMEEPLPDEPHPLPQLAPHLLDRAYLEYVATGQSHQSRIRTTLAEGLQRQLAGILEFHQKRLSGMEVHNLAALVLDVETGEVLAYAGNVIGAGAEHSEQVDVIKAPRSTGSILKPLLYALMLQDGQILPQSLIPDIPVQLSGYRPENYHENYDGVVPARRALIRSLNVPMVRMLQQYGLEKFHFNLRKLGLTTINQPPGYYGLPLVLGGAEGTLWDITNTYACMSRMLQHYPEYNARYDPGDFRPPFYLYPAAGEAEAPLLQPQPSHLSAAAAWFTFDAMQEVERPNSEGEWEHFASSRRIAWKTGTSFGFRDAWAIGVNPRYAVGVWAGNADGEGRPGLVGVLAAAPVLFDIFNRLPGEGAWFRAPYDDMIQLPVCRNSGYRPLDICPVDTLWAPASAIKAPPCPYHQLIFLDPSGKWRAHAGCELPGSLQPRAWFVLPPTEEHFYKALNPGYIPLPPFRPDCAGQPDQPVMELIYPKYPTKIYVPVGLDGKLSKTVFAATHRSPEATIYWHLDNEYIGSTHTFHSFELDPSEGEHRLTLVDEQGHRLEQPFEIIKKPGGYQ
ncbi:MAG: penicillin-binding protein 1C [Phaeodactylibacter sp.]|nr:penicillin-binding protein 1C [Phaeodactylibacter sp.]MCB9051513.1 penicillin-binding protein 1C [Lewinellaceae bacterium]